MTYRKIIPAAGAALLLATALLLARGPGRHAGRPAPAAPGPRIVSLAPSLTETLVELGLAGHIVGVTGQETAPEKLPAASDVGLYVRPDIERIIALEPDLVLFERYPGQERQREVLEEMGIRVETFRVARLDDIIGKVRRLGALTGREAAAAALAGELEATIGRHRRKAAAGDRTSVYIEVGYAPLFTAGRDSYLTELVALAGGASITAALPGDYPNISPEFVVSARPEVILLPAMSGAWLADITARPGWETVPAVADGRIHSDAGAHPITVPSPRLIRETLPALAALLERAPAGDGGRQP